MCRVYGYWGVNSGRFEVLRDCVGHSREGGIGAIWESGSRMTGALVFIRHAPFAIRYSPARRILSAVRASRKSGRHRLRRCRDHRARSHRRDALRRFAQFRRPADRRLRSAALFADARCRHCACRRRGGNRAARVSCPRCSIATGRRERWRISCAGRATSKTRRKAEFYPNVDKRTLFRDGYIVALRPFARLDRRSDAGAKPTARELDMGTPFDFFSPRSWPADRQHRRAKRKANRALFAAAMRRRGFRPYEKEWWHFTLSHEPFPAPISIFRCSEKCARRSLPVPLASNLSGKTGASRSSVATVTVASAQSCSWPPSSTP